MFHKQFESSVILICRSHPKTKKVLTNIGIKAMWPTRIIRAVVDGKPRCTAQWIIEKFNGVIDEVTIFM
jgi:hypothetical protein